MIVSGSNTQPAITIVIVNYNVKDFLLQCLRSVESAATEVDVEVIVVDNCSSDGSVAYLQPLFQNVHFIETEKNLGFGRANNLGINLAKAKYTLLLNPDTILSENTLSVMRNYLENRPEAGIVGCKVINPDGTFQVACRRGFPTPWASFCKLFGLQALFPHSPLFARYNQTFRSEDETYDVDALIGAFMFCRTEALQAAKGFDPQFFMYGEDLDLCFRIQHAGWKVAYYPATTIVHFKGESTRRSSINEVKVFYEAMTLFARKHYGNSGFLLIFLRLGIELRAILAYISKNFRIIAVIAVDCLFINLSLLVATKIRFGNFLVFPDYAYPAVFIVLTIVTLFSVAASGGYSGRKTLIRKMLSGMMIAFFVLSSLTYFFNEFAFSRGILLMTMGFSIVGGITQRLLWSFYDKVAGRESDRRFAIVGTSPAAAAILTALRTAEARNADIVGVISTGKDVAPTFAGLPVIGNVEYLPKLIEDYKLQEVIIAEASLPKHEIMRLAGSAAAATTRFHAAQEYEDLVIARLVNDIAGMELSIPRYNLDMLHYRLQKRLTDIFLAIFLLTFGLPVVILLAAKPKTTLRGLIDVLLGRSSVVGILPVISSTTAGKPGLTGLAHIARPETLTPQTIVRLNDYYAEHYTLALDADILIKHIFRRNNIGTPT